MEGFLEKINVEPSALYKGLTIVAIKVVAFLLILFIGFKIVKGISKKLKKNSSFKLVDPIVKSFLVSAIMIGLKVGVVFLAVIVVGVKVSAIVTIVGAVGLAVGLAIQGSLSNLAAGIMIITNKPFGIGDYVDLASTGGTVKDIGLFYSYLETADGRTVVIPNSIVTTSVVTNYSAATQRRIDFNLGVGYGVDLDQVKSVLLDIAAKDERVLNNPVPVVGISGHNDSSVGVLFRFWVKPENYWNIHYEMYGIVKKAFDEQQIDIPYPHMVMLKSDQ